MANFLCKLTQTSGVWHFSWHFETSVGDLSTINFHNNFFNAGHFSQQLIHLLLTEGLIFKYVWSCFDINRTTTKVVFL